MTSQSEQSEQPTAPFVTAVFRLNQLDSTCINELFRLTVGTPGDWAVGTVGTRVADTIPLRSDCVPTVVVTDRSKSTKGNR